MRTIVPMRWMAMVVGAAICGGACTADQPPGPVVLNGADIDVRDRELCWFYEWLVERRGDEEVPYIAAIAGEAVVEGKLSPLGGASVACAVDPENPCPGLVGDTWVNYVQELHLSDGSVRAGSFGHALLDEGRLDNPAWCEWRDAVELRQ